ncbi:MAG: TetR family transcriptional regulator [Rhodospirillales bacterium]
MARKPRKPKTRSKAKARTKARTKAKPDARTRIIDAALGLAAGRGWRRVRLAEIAAEAGVSMAELRAHFGSKWAIVGAFVRRTDDAVLAAGAAEGSSARDRLFDVLMRRFDALEPHRDAVNAILRDGLADPCAALCLGPRLLCSMAWMLETAGLSSAGPVGAVRVKGLTLVYLSALRVWLTDDSADLARTMASLDKGLRRAETLATAPCPGPGRKSKAPAKA